MKQIPNLITSVRLMSALILIVLCIADSSHRARYFLPIFIVAGISDMLDGLIARRFNWCTEFGARLDSISDMTLYAAVSMSLAVNAGSELAQCFSVFLLGCSIQLLHWALSVSRLGGFPAYHSTFSRIIAYCMFFGLIAFWYVRAPLIIAVLALAWIATSLEGIAISLVLRRAATDVSSIRSALLIRQRT
jgi:phosphatidylglycerophosphate synthase